MPDFNASAAGAPLHRRLRRLSVVRHGVLGHRLLGGDSEPAAGGPRHRARRGVDRSTVPSAPCGGAQSMMPSRDATQCCVGGPIFPLRQPLSQVGPPRAGEGPGRLQPSSSPYPERRCWKEAAPTCQSGESRRCQQRKPQPTAHRRGWFCSSCFVWFGCLRQLHHLAGRHPRALAAIPARRADILGRWHTRTSALLHRPGLLGRRQRRRPPVVRIRTAPTGERRY
jgi:hypothetical protein